MALNDLFSRSKKYPEENDEQYWNEQEKVDDIQQTLSEETTEVNTKEPEKTGSEDKNDMVVGDQLKILGDGLKKIIDSLQFVAESQKEMSGMVEDVITSQEMTIRKQHESISRFQNDLLLKSQKDLIMEMIGIADQIQYTLEDQKTEQNYEKLVEDVKNLGEWVEASLNTVAVRKFVETENGKKEIDRKRQEVTGVVATSKEEEDGLLRHQVPGYIWAMPWLIVNTEVQLQNLMEENRKAKMFEFVLRPEQMVRLKFEKKVSNDSDEPPTEDSTMDSKEGDSVFTNDLTED